MDFRTGLQIPVSETLIDHSTRMMLWGSCFSENIGQKLMQHKFQVMVNPFGILYNPLSVSLAIKRLLHRETFNEAELVLNNDLYHSFMHHGRFSDRDKDTCLRNISTEFDKAADFIQKTDWYLITFGTAYAYQWKESGEVVGNCHKFSAEKFLRFRLSIEEIVEEWSEVIVLLAALNPKARFLFTVSPIRHWKDGAHENQISKSILHLSIDCLQERFRERVSYFPAYEIMIDELRDYRFYDDDMVHPSALALEYIWQLFSETFFSSETRKINDEWAQIRRSLNHCPLHPETESYRKFLLQTLQKLETFIRKYPRISCENERQHISAVLKSFDHVSLNSK